MIVELGLGQQARHTLLMLSELFVPIQNYFLMTFQIDKSFQQVLIQEAIC